jgi:uncharacterized protein DUF3761
MLRLRLTLAIAALAAPLAIPGRVSAQGVACKDGTTASQSGRGACSHHGGVAATIATVSCKDGTTADAGRGACSHHGGVGHATSTRARSSTRVTRSSREETAAPASRSTYGLETVSCGDGTTAHVGRGACSHHGGVAPAATRTSTRGYSPSYGRTTSSGPVPCQDGTSSAGGRGACSHHGGIDVSATGSETSRPPAPREDVRSSASTAGRPTSAGATARCNDGTYSESAHRVGACSHHGGVSEWLEDVPAR